MRRAGGRSAVRRLRAWAARRAPARPPAAAPRLDLTASALELAAVARRIAELRVEGLAPQAIADVLNEEVVPPPGVDLAWQPWSVREAAGTWPPRKAARRLPRGPGPRPPRG